ncbi:DMT family transporter [Kordiimonas aquimaris]|uniref:DMT family transporter n=1 Tax=Kordiimonas aquimaris TaxID=707591 RepID=UPI0021CE456E|nr:DMT family transporter [Kordiimonas aquimaris]
MTKLSDNMRGALFMVLGMMGFTFNDGLMKLISSDLHLFQSIFIRGVMATTLIGILAWRNGALLHPKAKMSRLLIVRMLAEMGGTFCYLTALFNIPLADATAILMASPLAVTLAASLFLRERVGWRRYIAIAIGFIGVVVILRPSADGINTFYLFALGTVFFMVLRDLCTRRFDPEMPSLFIAFTTSTLMTLASAAMIPFDGWQQVSTKNISVLAGAAIFIFFGYLFTIMTVRVGEISFAAPFRYTALIWAMIIGVVMFNHIPDTAVLIGSTIVVTTGLYSLLRERTASSWSVRNTRPSL